MLYIYYDNPNKASDTYLKYLLKDCKENDIEVKIINDKLSIKHEPTLFLEPTKDPSIDKYKNLAIDVDSPSATACGILYHIIENYDRSTCIGVIGRGLVGKQLIDMLIEHGYTVVEMNSKTPYKRMEHICYWECDVVVGLASSDEPIFDNRVCDQMTSCGIELIDASNNFDTDKKLRCGKWTRKIIMDRVSFHEEQC